MAYNSTLTEFSAHSSKSALSAIGGFLASIGAAMVKVSSNNGRLKEVDRLQAKTDADLAAMGLKREDIVHHVFRDMYYL